MDCDIAELYAMAMENTGAVYPPIKSARAQRRFVEFLCDEYEVKHTVSNGIDFLLRKIEEATGSISHSFGMTSGNIKPPRELVLDLIEHNIKRGSSNHEENKVIAFELLNAGWSDSDISFVFKSIYDEPAGNWGWYSNNPNEAGSNIIALRAKGINRYSSDKLDELMVRKSADK
jgi:hypothetical protein